MAFPNIQIGDRVRVISGGIGALGADGLYGVVVSGKEAMQAYARRKSYDGETIENIAELYIRTDKGNYWGLCKGCGVIKVKENQIPPEFQRAIKEVSVNFSQPQTICFKEIGYPSFHTILNEKGQVVNGMGQVIEPSNFIHKSDSKKGVVIRGTAKPIKN